MISFCFLFFFNLCIYLFLLLLLYIYIYIYIFFFCFLFFVFCLFLFFYFVLLLFLLLFLFRARCDFWDVSSPSTITTYTLTVTAPDEEDWLFPVPNLSKPYESPDPSQSDLHCPTVTVPEPALSSSQLTISPWDFLKDATVSLREFQREGASAPVTVQVLHPSPSSSALSSLSCSPHTAQVNHQLNHSIASHNSHMLICAMVSKPTTFSITPSNHIHQNSSNSFPNLFAVRNFKIPKKNKVISSSKPAGTPHTHQPTIPSASPPGPAEDVRTDSEEAVANSVALARQHKGLCTAPCSLVFSIVNSSGRRWTSFDLKGGCGFLHTEMFIWRANFNFLLI